MNNDLVVLQGRFAHVVYRNETNFYTVARFVLNNKKQTKITVTGNMPHVEKDALYEVEGCYQEHPRYGMQFQAMMVKRVLPTKKEGIIRYLSSAQFAGIGEVTAEKIAEALGDNCLRLLKEDISSLWQVKGLTQRQFDAIAKGLEQDDPGMEELSRFLGVSGIGMNSLSRLFNAYGRQAMEKLRENPYRVIEECEGFGFETADKLAASLGVEQDDPRRLYALLVSMVMRMCMASGDSYVLAENLRQRFERETQGQDFDGLLERAVIKNSLVEEDGRIYAFSQYEAERTVAMFLASFPDSACMPKDKKEIEEKLLALEEKLGISYDDVQKEAVHSFFSEDMMIMTGGPGTGKTTLVKAFVTLFAQMYPGSKIVLAAPTGRATKRLGELTGFGALTLHSLLKWDLETNTFAKNQKDPLECDLLIVDEFSMVDAYLFSSLLKASANIRKMCLVGDQDQLPSVGPGCVLRDLISCGRFKVVALEHIYRQANDSNVVALSHDIRRGHVDMSAYGDKDVAFFECPCEEIRNKVIEVVGAFLDKGLALEDVQVLSPMYEGAAGIHMLNKTIQEMANPADPLKREMQIGYQTFREGDKILQLKNQPDDNVFNGDIGILSEIIDKSESEDDRQRIIVQFDDVFVEYTQETWGNITLAYCISVHKSQGSEYPVVVMPFDSRMRYMLQRRLIYTAVSRAKLALALIGEQEAFAKGVSTGDRKPRMTSLSERIIQWMPSDLPF